MDITKLTEDGSIRWDWTGTPSQLVKLAKNSSDPAMPSRRANFDDYDFKWLNEVYRQILEWDKKGRPVPNNSND